VNDESEAKAGVDEVTCWFSTGLELMLCLCFAHWAFNIH
jgi:hypothetical protein